MAGVIYCERCSNTSADTFVRPTEGDRGVCIECEAEE